MTSANFQSIVDSERQKSNVGINLQLLKKVGYDTIYPSVYQIDPVSVNILIKNNNIVKFNKFINVHIKKIYLTLRFLNHGTESPQRSFMEVAKKLNH